MTPEEAVRGLLNGHAPLIALVAERITPQVNTEEPVTPFVVYERNGLEKSPLLSGTSSLSKVLVDVTAYGDTESQTHPVATAVVDALNGVRDQARGVQGIFHVDSQTGMTEDSYRFLKHTFAVWHRKAT